MIVAVIIRLCSFHASLKRTTPGDVRLNERQDFPGVRNRQTRFLFASLPSMPRHSLSYGSCQQTERFHPGRDFPNLSHPDANPHQVIRESQQERGPAMRKAFSEPLTKPKGPRISWVLLAVLSLKSGALLFREVRKGRFRCGLWLQCLNRSV